MIIYFSHGGGPLPILGDPSHDAMNDFMKKLPAMIEKPEAILVISAHWEESQVTIQSGSQPEMLYDYYGFPQEAYSIDYPAKGNPELAEQIAVMLEDHDIPFKLDVNRGFDHGLYIPLMMMYPLADIPSIQISLLHSLDSMEHIRLGQSLKALGDENILVVGSGFSYHNMRGFDMAAHPKQDELNDAFQDWLIDCCTRQMPQQERIDRLSKWEEAPSARYCHPREEHLLPLQVCAGMAGKAGKLIFDDYIAGKRAVAFLWR